MKFCWDVLNSQEDWAMLLKGRSMRNKAPSTYHLYSSIWSKHEYLTIISNSYSLIGNCLNTNFWLNYWRGSPLIETTHLNLINKVNIDS